MTNLADSAQTTTMEYRHILPQLCDIIRELAVHFADLYLHCDTIVLMTDNRDWPDLPHGREVVRTIFHRIRYTRKER